MESRINKVCELLRMPIQKREISWSKLTPEILGFDVWDLARRTKAAVLSGAEPNHKNVHGEAIYSIRCPFREMKKKHADFLASVIAMSPYAYGGIQFIADKGAPYLTLDMTVNGSIIGKRKQIRAIGTGRISDLIDLVKMYCVIQNGATEYSWNKKTQALWATQNSTTNQRGKVWQIFKDSGISLTDSSGLNKLEACKLIDLGESLSQIRQRKHLIEQSCVTDDKGKLTPEAKAAKAELDKMFKAENKETKKAQALFGDLKQAIATKYKEHMDLLARNKSRSDAQVDEEGRFFEINLSFAPQKIAATPKQVSYAKSLILRAQGYENYFPGVDPQHFDRRQAQLFIGLLVMLDSQHERVPRTFTDACEVLRDVSLHAPFKRCYRFHYVSQNDLSTDAAMSS